MAREFRLPDIGEGLADEHATACDRFAVAGVSRKGDVAANAVFKKLQRCGFSVVPVVIGFLVLTFAPLVRRLEKRQAAAANGARLATWAAHLPGQG